MEAGAAAQQLMIHELLTGRKFANELRHRLLATSNLQDHQHDLVAKILHSFKKSISIFNRHHRRRITTPPPHHHSNFKKKSRESWTREHSTPNIDDGHSWRKYGQKTIRGYKHQRSYYRCRHKFEEGCKATKQVQQIEDYPAAAKYKTTFLGQHSCSRTNYNTTPTDANFYMMKKKMSGSTDDDDDDDLQQQGDTSNFLSSSSVDTQAGAGFPVNSSAGRADTDNYYYDQHDDDVHDHHLLIRPSHDHDLTAAIFDSVLATNYDQQVDEFDAADNILGFPF